jgi:hypothetical protein
MADAVAIWADQSGTFAIGSFAGHTGGGNGCLSGRCGAGKGGVTCGTAGVTWGTTGTGRKTGGGAGRGAGTRPAWAKTSPLPSSERAAARTNAIEVFIEGPFAFI